MHFQNDLCKRSQFKFKMKHSIRIYTINDDHDHKKIKLTSFRIRNLWQSFINNNTCIWNKFTFGIASIVLL